MAETTEKATINAENYSELIGMLKSNDEGSVSMALTILEQSDFEESKIFTLCALKETFDKVFKNSEMFEKNYPVLHKKITENLLEASNNMATLSFKRIYELAVERKRPEELEFMLRIFRDELVRLLKDYGFSFLDYLDIEVRPKAK